MMMLLLDDDAWHVVMRSSSPVFTQSSRACVRLAEHVRPTRPPPLCQHMDCIWIRCERRLPAERRHFL